jgi:hypothetical protein
MIASICCGVLVTAEIRLVTDTGNWWPLVRQYVHVALSLVRPSGCSHVEVAWADGLDGFAGVGGSERVDIGRGGFVGGAEVLGAAGFDQVALVVRGREVKLLQGPVAAVDAALQQCLHRRDIKGVLHQRTFQIG